MSPMQLVDVNDKWPLWMNPNRADHDWWPHWEAARLAKTHQLITEEIVTRSAPVVYEIGAEEGDFPALYGTWGAEVVLIEPSPFSWPQIRAHWEANIDRPPAGWFVGLASDHDTDVEPDYDDTVRGGWPECSYRRQRPEYGFRHIWEHFANTRQNRLDTLIVSHGWPPPDLLCIDVEGAEGHVLRGAETILMVHRPHIIVALHHEGLANLYQTTAEEAVHDYMTQVGYTGTHLDTDHEEHFWFAP